ncbi:type III effector HrpK [Pseudomonas viridiflava]|uniref:pectate lyase n=1 Tax=Pseudomonas viridiflava TaxID=33069 RepID=UPI0010BFDE50|nr:pectate lyase [Pseudomonas viridiflava]TKJ68325.1 type III effector HrpK [Pseudomonas viridiflava]TKK31098.1 type III effector HrpK [Pseudomonas viridiflava]
MSIGISGNSYQPTTPALDFSALNGNGLKQSQQPGQSGDQSIDPGALLFNTGNQRNVNFGQPAETKPLDSTKDSGANDDLMSMLQQLMDNISSMFQMLAKMLSGQNKANEQTQDPNEFQNDSGLGSEPTDSGDGGGTPEATGGSGGGGTPGATGGGSGGGSGGGGGTPGATGNGGGTTHSVNTPSAGPGHTSGTGSTPGANPVQVPKSSGETVVVNETIKVAAGKTFDGGGKTFTASNKLGTGDQSENQKPLFELAEGATLKNVNLGENEADGIHVKAKTGEAVTIQNLHAQNVGEDLITVKGEGGAKVTNLNILDSSAKGADDKIIQLNANTHLNVDGFKADEFGKLVRTNGTPGHSQFSDMSLKLNNIDATHGKAALVQSDSEGLKLTTSNIRMTDVAHDYKLASSTDHVEA